MPAIKVSTQQELDAAARSGATDIEVDGSEPLTFRGAYSPDVRIAPNRTQKIVVAEDSALRLHVTLRSSPLVEIRDRAAARVSVSGEGRTGIHLRDSAMASIDVYGAAQVDLDADDHATARVEVSGSASLRARASGAAYMRVYAHGRASVRYQGRGEVTAGERVPVVHDGKATVSGGVQVVLAAIVLDEEPEEKDEKP